MADLSNAMETLRAAAARIDTDAPSHRSPRAADDVEQSESCGKMCVNRARFIPVLRDLMFSASQMLRARSDHVGVLCTILVYACTNILSPDSTLQSLLAALRAPSRSSFVWNLEPLR